MKLVSKTDFYNTKSLGIVVDPKSAGFKHKDVIHKGARFEVGRGEFFKDLQTSEKEIVGSLVRFNLVAIDDKENQSNGVIKQIDEEVAAQEAAFKKIEEASKKSHSEK